MQFQDKKKPLYVSGGAEVDQRFTADQQAGADMKHKARGLFLS